MEKSGCDKISEEELKIIDKVVNRLAPKYKFGYFDIEDIKQQGRLFALQAMDKYDPAQPLENFLCVHVKNRLINFKRDNYCRIEPPCEPPSDENEPDYNKWNAWQKRNETKKNLMEPLDITNIRDEDESNMRMESEVITNAETAEYMRIIDKQLPLELRADLLRIRASVNIPKIRRERVYNAVKKIIKEEDLYIE